MDGMDVSERGMVASVSCVNCVTYEDGVERWAGHGSFKN
jgi:hypothetical protein